jgi:hypothetical protein
MTRSKRDRAVTILKSFPLSVKETQVPRISKEPAQSNMKKMATSAKTLHMNELQVVFHLPMAEAAVKLGVCSTVLKKICRRKGISRWPYRQIRKIDKVMSCRRRCQGLVNLISQTS